MLRAQFCRRNADCSVVSNAVLFFSLGDLSWFGGLSSFGDLSPFGDFNSFGELSWFGDLSLIRALSLPVHSDVLLEDSS
jgi:hypothetical protein